MASKNRYDGLTVAQTQTLGRIAMGERGPFHPKTINALRDRCLIAKREVQVGVDRFGPLMVTVYEMPLLEHMRYCQWCADTFSGPSPEPHAP